ncbi:MAG: PadR family transcriptional regulator [Desulfomicrobium apsheronum]|nr:PadR family transcriptional regulator [Desulfomicrobium apsheronum]
MELSQCACSGKSLARLLRPAVLALLVRGETHGYDLVQQLNGLDIYADLPPDTSGIYKLLKSMEREGLVTAIWELGDNRPAKRRYTLTKDGRECLRRWQETLLGYRVQIDGLLALLKSDGCQFEGGASANSVDPGGSP